MKKIFRNYIVCWVIVLAVFNIICFVSPDTAEIAGTEYVKFGGAFWTGYIFITLAFIGQLVCAGRAFSAENNQRLFYNIPLITISYTGLILMLIAGSAVMAVPDLPNWVGIIVCVIILAFSVIAVIKSDTAADIVEEVDEKVKVQTKFIKTAMANAQNIMNRAKTDDAKNVCIKVYEALRYSDPMSSSALSVEDAKITIKMDELSTAVNASADNISEIADEVLLLINERNSKCRALK